MHIDIVVNPKVIDKNHRCLKLLRYIRKHFSDLSGCEIRVETVGDKFLLIVRGDDGARFEARYNKHTKKNIAEEMREIIDEDFTKSLTQSRSAPTTKRPTHR